MIIISLISAYLMVSCIISTALYILSDDYDFALYCGLIWPLGIPLFIGLAIIAIVGTLINIIIGFFTKKIKNTNLCIERKKICLEQK